MSFHVYFASNWKDSVNDPRIFPAQFGYGFTESGMPRFPEKAISDALRILDDAILPKRIPDTAAIARLAQQCGNGCFFDFERAPTQIHAAIIRKLSHELRGQLLFAAERFMPLSSSLLPLVTAPQRCTNWQRFAMQTGAHYPKGWVLELIPCNDSVQMPLGAQGSGKLRDALCCYQQRGKTIRYFDTWETLSQKMILARENGCRAAIGLLEELQPLMQLERQPFT